ncbi:MAG: hypothetical protein AAFX51_16085, partial [Cyanobacteria bacterium J06636_28]
MPNAVISTPNPRLTQISRPGVSQCLNRDTPLLSNNHHSADPINTPPTILSFVLLFAGFAPTGLSYGQAVVMVG